jgi:bifunctional UDP-N-acetylglucosamine pyrophosphorylase/glucosamine-1-phosphate N-acetyltransferase
MKCVILAGGRGVRFGELTEGIPKVMLEIDGRPMVQVILENFKKAGFREFVMVVGYKKEKVKEYFGDGSKFGVKIEYAFQKEQKGTADAVRYAEPFIKEDRFFLIHGDVIIGPEAMKKIADLEKPVMCLKKVEDPSRFGVVETSGDKIVRILEKTENPTSNLINAGVFVLPREIFDAIRKTPLSDRGEYELTDAIQIMIREGKDLDYFVLDGTLDIGTKEIYTGLTNK